MNWANHLLERKVSVESTDARYVVHQGLVDMSICNNRSLLYSDGATENLFVSDLANIRNPVDIRELRLAAKPNE